MAKARTRASSAAGDPTKLGRDFKRHLKTGPVVLGGMVMEYLRPSLVKLYRHAGFDFIFVENQHALFRGPELSDFVLSARDNRLPVISKVGQLERAEVARLLEAGVVGIQLPSAESRDELLALIDYMKFPPGGSRPGAPCYGNVDYVWPEDDRAWMKRADASTLAVAHIETERGYQNAEEIIATPGLDMVYVGPYDFSIAMGHPGEYDHPEVVKPMESILKRCLRHKIPFGTTASGPKAAARWVKKGCRFFEVVDELTLISAGAAQTVQAYRRLSP